MDTAIRRFSIGSLGRGGLTDNVEKVYVRDSVLKGTKNGLRIKTWQGGSGYARKISFEGITLDTVAKPIIIDQFYCDQQPPCQNQSTSAVKVSDVYFSRVHGTTSTDKAVELKCSQIVACTNIVLTDINIVSASPEDTTTGAYCFNAYGSAGPTVPLV
ncbi:probable polygalacturonase At1g80170 [Malus domestica]|uniref:probable polygalacturonase At1g80170 n=1 Tax=Malus domestica TaxID=3750 RepID=UPI003976A6A8